MLTDGGTVHLRPIRSDDDDGLLGLFARLSSESIYMRFFSPVSRRRAQQLEHLTHVDYDSADGARRRARRRRSSRSRATTARPDGDEAEVAFTVQDDQQGRGLAHDHARAPRRGRPHARHRRRSSPRRCPTTAACSACSATPASRSCASSPTASCTSTFPIDPTETSQAMQDEREQISEARSVRRLLAPQSIAVIGAGRRPGTIGHEVFRNLLAGDFTGPVYPVNPHADVVASVRAYPTDPRRPRPRRPRGRHRPGRVGGRGRAASARTRACTGSS